MKVFKSLKSGLFISAWREALCSIIFIGIKFSFAAAAAAVKAACELKLLFKSKISNFRLSYLIFVARYFINIARSLRKVSQSVFLYSFRFYLTLFRAGSKSDILCSSPNYGKHYLVYSSAVDKI